MSLLMSSVRKDYPYGFFADMEAWPDELRPAGEEDIILYAGFLRHERGIIVQKLAIFVDPQGRLWELKPGEYCNGISSPRILWRLIYPYAEKLREASAFHDVYCDSKMYSQRDTHRVFWQIMRANTTQPVIALAAWLCVTCFCRIRYWSWA